MILHVDMDAFYASVEERENPELKGKPMVVGGEAESRGVVAAANYAARKYGIFSAMPMAIAVRKYPGLIIIKPNPELYNTVSQQIREIFLRYTPIIEPLSLDEAFLDTSGSEKLHGSSEQIGRKIKHDIARELFLVASVGVAPNKFLAKLASDYDKPDGFTLIREDSIQSFLDPLPVDKIWGVGKVANQKFRDLGIYTVADLRTELKESLIDIMGKHGEQLWELAHGIDNRAVTPDSEVKSISKETTFSVDINSIATLESVAFSLTEAVGFRLREARLKGRTVNLKLRFDNFHTITRSQTIPVSTDQTDTIWKTASMLLNDAFKTQTSPVRLVGVGMANFGAELEQKDLFNLDTERTGQRQRGELIDRLSDDIRHKFGNKMIARGKSLGRNSTGKTGEK
jgi:DNA polymerase-4